MKRFVLWVLSWLKSFFSPRLEETIHRPKPPNSPVVAAEPPPASPFSGSPKLIGADGKERPASELLGDGEKPEPMSDEKKAAVAEALTSTRDESMKEMNRVLRDAGRRAIELRDDLERAVLMYMDAEPAPDAEAPIFQLQRVLNHIASIRGAHPRSQEFVELRAKVGLEKSPSAHTGFQTMAELKRTAEEAASRAHELEKAGERMAATLDLDWAFGMKEGGNLFSAEEIAERVKLVREVRDLWSETVDR